MKAYKVEKFRHIMRRSKLFMSEILKFENADAVTLNNDIGNR